MLKFDFNLLWTVINLIIFFLLMRLFLLKPIKKVLTARREMIDNQFKQAQDTVDEANGKLKDYEQRIANADDEAKAIITDARDKAKAEYNKIVDKASDDVRQMQADAQKKIALDSENARQAVKEEIAKLAVETAQKVVGRSASAEVDSKIYDEFLNESSEQND